VKWKRKELTRIKAAGRPAKETKTDANKERFEQPTLPKITTAFPLKYGRSVYRTM